MKRGDGLRRSTPLQARTELRRTTELPRSTPLPRTSPPLRSVPTGDSRTPGKVKPARDIPSATRKRLYLRDSDRCVSCGREVGPGTRSAQHRAPRGMGSGLADPHRMSNLLTVCGVLSTEPGTCVEWMERRRVDAQAWGFLVPLGVDPAAWAVRAWDGWHLYDDDGGRTETGPYGATDDDEEDVDE